jgi:two-component system NtrC family sensor kinase
MIRDMTDEIRLSEQLIQQEKLAAVGQLVSGVAHELNNPLAGVMAFSQLLLSSPASRDAEARRAAETIHREAKRAAKIVSNLLTFARQQPAERAETDLNALVSDTLELRRFNLRAANIDVETVLDSGLPRTWADPFQLQQVLLNLIGNAEHALAEWRGIRRVTIRTGRDGDQLALSVSDTGPGVPLEKRDRIFNPFFTTKPVGQGTGLGLSISDGIAREHGGRLRVESQEGEGATFVLELPFVPLPGVAATGVARPTPGARDRRRVLVVDDEPAMRSAMSAFLGSLGHDVTVAASGSDAGRLLANGGYDAILLDLRLSDVGGDVLYRELRARDPEQAARVVFVTGDTQSDLARRFLAESGRPSLGKPFQLDDLATVIAAVTR